MRLSTSVVFVVLMTVGAVFIARSISTGSNIDKREKYWKEEISKSIHIGTSKDELEIFAKSHGQALHCYQNYNTKENQCDFDDNQSFGGTTRLPMRLAVIFTIKNDKVISHQLTTTLANKPK